MSLIKIDKLAGLPTDILFFYIYLHFDLKFIVK